MKLYLAGPFENRSDIAVVALALARDGHEITSRWLTEHAVAFTQAEHARQARVDLADIEAADALVLVNEPGSERGGRHFETGYAFALGKRIYVIGQRTNVFHHLGDVLRVRSVEELRRTLARS
jgi:nucleoside 2-deoxyribosyltransferase